MSKIDLTKYGINGSTEIVYNPSYEVLFEEETKADLTGYEVGQVTELGAVNVMTGIYTGRSPKDKYIVMDENSKDTVWWTTDEYKNDNHPMTEETWAVCKDLAVKELSNKRLFVIDAFCGANADTRLSVRFIMEVAWQAHFVKNMFIQPSAEELEKFEPDFIVYNASKAKVENFKDRGDPSLSLHRPHQRACQGRPFPIKPHREHNGMGGLGIHGTATVLRQIGAEKFLLRPRQLPFQSTAVPPRKTVGKQRYAERLDIIVLLHEMLRHRGMTARAAPVAEVKKMPLRPLLLEISEISFKIRDRLP